MREFKSFYFSIYFSKKKLTLLFYFSVYVSNILTPHNIPPHTRLYQVDDGTIFYHKSRGEEGKQRLYVISKRKDYEADLLDVDLLNMGAFGNALYYCTESREIRRAIFSSDHGIAMSSIRSMGQDESIESEGMCSRIVNGRTFVYRLSDDPEKDSIHIDINKEQLKVLTLRCIHRGKAIFTKIDKSREIPYAYAMTDNVIVVEVAKRFGSLSSAFATPQDHSPYLYLPMNHALHALNTASVKFLQPAVLASHICNPGSVGVHDGKIFMTGEYLEGVYLFIVTLPENFFNRDIATGYTNWKITYASRFVSEFSIQGTVGSGSFGCVFKAKNKFDEGEYAIKCISLTSNTSRDQIWNTLGEVRKMSQLHHPGIVRYHATWIEEPPDGWKYPSSHWFEDPHRITGGETRFRVFIQMELCKESLENWFNRTMEARNQKQMKAWFKQIIEALEHIHSFDLIHRDMKPKNVLVASDEFVKICDLGIATDSGDRDTWRTNIGTDMYKAPEQTNIYDKMVDIFSVGLVLLEMSAILSEKERTEAFKNIRCAISLNILQDQPSTLDLITRLTKLNKDERPTFDEILSHPYFTD